MKLKDILKFEPIDITHIVITIGLVFIVIYSFKSQLDSFFETLQHRPITVKMSGSETTIELEAPVKPSLFSGSIETPQGSEQDLNNWERIVEHVNNIEGFQKMGFNDLFKNLSALPAGGLAVINFTVDHQGINYLKLI